LRCAELLVAVLIPVGGTPTRGGEVPVLHESGLENGLRILVSTPEGDASIGRVVALLALRVGWANDGAKPDSGLAAALADYATLEDDGSSPWQVELLPTVTLFAGSFPTAELESRLATLAKRLGADGVDDERLKKVLAKRVAPPASAFDRLREAAWPTTRLGARPFGAPAEGSLTKESLKQFAAQRVGSEGGVLALVGEGPPATLDLLAAKVFSGFPRARGVAPAEAFEPYPRRSRRVAAPAAAGGGLAGFRLAWCADPQGDERALALAWLEALAGRPAARVEWTAQGALVAFAIEGDVAPLRDRLLAGAEQLARGQPLSEEGFATVLSRVDQGLAAATATPLGLARLLVDEELSCGDPLAAFGRRKRLEAAGAAAAAASLRAQLPAEGYVEAAPATAADPRGS
jgi:hypothetical protein